MATAVSVLVLMALSAVTTASTRPHIVMFIVDDMGWNDIGYNNLEGQIKTPTLDDFASKGVKMNNSYVQPLCSPSRASLLSGMYPLHLGLQHGIITDNKPIFLPASATTLPETLKTLGYKTHMVGKWHLGFCNLSYTPTHRGFDTFMGFYSGAEDYYTHKTGATGRAYDFRLNEDVYYPPSGEHATYTFTNRAIDIIKSHNKSEAPLFLYMAHQLVHYPLTPPDSYLDYGIKNDKRRKYAAMVNMLDESFKNITDTLTDEGYDDRLLITFTSDNGGDVHNGGNNFPLRGTKGTYWEGGTKSVSFIYSPPGSNSLLQKAGYTNDALIHASDWYPTLVKAAGGTPDPDLDGINQWDVLRNDEPSNRTHIVYNIDEVDGSSAIRDLEYKLVQNETSRDSGWYEVHNRFDVIGDGSVHLFNLIDDPFETTNIAANYTDKVNELQAILQSYVSTMVPSQQPPRTPAANPSHWGDIWSPGWC